MRASALPFLNSPCVFCVEEVEVCLSNLFFEKNFAKFSLCYCNARRARYYPRRADEKVCGRYWKKTRKFILPLRGSVVGELFWSLVMECTINYSDEKRN